MNYNNLELRLFIDKKMLKYKDIADEMGVSHEWLSRIMSQELTIKQKDKIFIAIGSLLRKKGNENDVLILQKKELEKQISDLQMQLSEINKKIRAEVIE